MTPAIEELEKLASRFDLGVYAELIGIATRLRTEYRDGKREALSQSARDLVISWAIPLLERALRHHGSGGQMIPCCDGHVKLGELKLAITDDHDVLSTRHARAIEALRGMLADYDSGEIGLEYIKSFTNAAAARAVLDEEEKG